MVGTLISATDVLSHLQMVQDPSPSTKTHCLYMLMQTVLIHSLLKQWQLLSLFHMLQVVLVLIKSLHTKMPSLTQRNKTVQFNVKSEYQEDVNINNGHQTLCLVLHHYTQWLVNKLLKMGILKNSVTIARQYQLTEISRLTSCKTSSLSEHLLTVLDHLWPRKLSTKEFHII